MSAALLKTKELLVQRESGEINMTDEEIYAKIKFGGKRVCDRGNGISPSITSLYESFSEGEKLRKEAEEAKNEANEAKNEANEAKKEANAANAKNKVLCKEMKVLKKQMEVMRGCMGKFLNLFGYDLSEINMDEVDEDESEEDDEYDELQTGDEEE